MSTILSTVGIYIILISTIYCNKKVGYNNSLTCNCNYEASCQDSGMCTYGGCKQGWSGPTCQKQNVALHKPANQSSYYRQDWPSSRGVDGDKSTFIDMNPSKQGWWLVDLQQSYPITGITLYNRPGYLYRLRGFSVYIIGEDLVSTLCYHHTNEHLTVEYKIRCNSTGRYINITSAINQNYLNYRYPEAILNLSEVEIYGCSDTNSYGDGCKLHCDDRKCNGASDCDHVTGACLYGCQDGWDSQDCTRVCSREKYGERCQELCSGRNCKSSDSTCNHVNGTCVGGCKAGWTSNDCTLGCSDTNSYGDGCKLHCDDRKCNGASDCDHVTGACLYGCQDGWDSQDCTRVCSREKYGERCQELCSGRNCKSSDSTCNHVNGTCVGGCKAGWTSNDCTLGCSDTNSYGDGCKLHCDDRKCNGASDCDHVTGACLYGCQDGWDSQDCTRVCSREKYGERCQELCSGRNCKSSDSTCNHVNGTCVGGCKAGWTSNDCTLVCSQGSYGASCQQQCSGRNCKSGDSTCDHVNGTCVGGCKAGWISDDCTLDCETGFYGPGCAKKCSERKCLNVTSSCDRINGECDKGCEEGYNGIDCMALVEKQHGGMPLPVEIIAPAAACVVILILVVLIITLLFIRRRRRRSTSQSKHVDGVNITGTNPRLAIVQPTRRRREKDYEEHHNMGVYATINDDELELTSNKVTNFDKESDPVTSVNHYETVSIDEHNKSVASMDTDIPTEVQVERSSDPPIASEDSNYYNLLNINTDLKLDQFESFFIKTKDTDGFKHIFLFLSNDFTASYDISQKPENKSKNRFRGYYPYDYSRVVLQKSKTDPHSDFINANFIDGYRQPKAYIAAQGATKVTINDFVRMIWEQKCDNVVMLTNVKEQEKTKCEQYWPEQGSQKFGDISLTLNEERVRADFTVRRITMSKGTETHRFHHFHYTSWPDHDVPNVSDLLDFLYMVNKHKPNSNKPQIIHCSAGVGRTGTYIAIDFGLKQGKETGCFDVIEFTKAMRNQRKGMIQTAGQFQFVFEALTEGFEYGDTRCDRAVYESKLDFKQEPMQVGTLSLKTQYQFLRQIKPETKSTDSLDSHPQSLPVSFPSRTNLNGYIVAALNRHNTESIWRLIQNKQCSVVVALLNNENDVAICPEAGTEETVGSLKLESKTDVGISENLNIICVSTSEEGADTKSVKVLIMNIRDSRFLLPLVNQMKELIEEIDIHHSDDNHPIAIFSNEPLAGQLFCVIRNIIQRIKLDNEVEIFENVRKMHQQISCLVKSEEEYLSLHRFAAEYVKSSSVYVNV